MQCVGSDTKPRCTSSDFRDERRTAARQYPTSLATGYDIVCNVSESITTMAHAQMRSRSSTHYAANANWKGETTDPRAVLFALRL
jgi:hypothetical protein